MFLGNNWTQYWIHLCQKQTDECWCPIVYILFNSVLVVFSLECYMHWKRIKSRKDIMTFNSKLSYCLSTNPNATWKEIDQVKFNSVCTVDSLYLPEKSKQTRQGRHFEMHSHQLTLQHMKMWKNGKRAPLSSLILTASSLLLCFGYLCSTFVLTLG